MCFSWKRRRSSRRAKAHFSTRPPPGVTLRCSGASSCSKTSYLSRQHGQSFGWTQVSRDARRSHLFLVHDRWKRTNLLLTFLVYTWTWSNTKPASPMHGLLEGASGTLGMVTPKIRGSPDTDRRSLHFPHICTTGCSGDLPRYLLCHPKELSHSRENVALGAL